MAAPTCNDGKLISTEMLKPKLPNKELGVRATEGGMEEVWEGPLLLEARVGASKLTLHPFSLSLPKYSDSALVCYVLQGNGLVGVVFPDTEKEQVKKVRKGDVVALPLGTFNWWHNTHAQENLCVLSLGDTSQALKYGQFTNFYLMGCKDKVHGGIMHGFSTDFVAQAWDLDEPTVKMMLERQSGAAIIKLHAPLRIEETKEEAAGYGKFVYNCEDAKKDVDVKNGGRVAVITSDNLPILSQIGLGADLVKLDPGAMCSPGFSADAAYQVTYVVRGSGRVQMVSNEGERVVDTEIKGGYFFIVPRFHVVSKRAGPDGLEWFSIITKEKPIFSHLGGKTSVWKALSADVLSASFNVDKEMEQHFRSRRMQDAIFFPPK
ncbi:hypothetical protein GOP47_0015638 [Adiantum capillus-veneris]|uniref:Cupin type-1 domain-containing protein n=1 Tax=Adiantum capillus-veneris TaxID=13818 RepID=A0A9D4ZCT6_ADICA|nr:hypothetical protein GOP47_0015638 [Adiantum capillus-veneris]